MIPNPIGNPEAEDIWVRESDGEAFTTEELAELIDDVRPDLTEEQILSKLNDGRVRATPPRSGHEDDLMAILKNDPHVWQSDLDFIASQAGLVVEIRPGDVLLSNDPGEQNLVITRTEDLFVPAGETAHTRNLWVPST